ncbi:MAG: 2-C-methyl-D-erythritol 4-phosphate cytidylyltransferase, partial [Clostridia bacterium]|nr:2-C-methyl-D-erythritol 4-phosphate cytidylyltransferase [Clostridia bacterium]
MYKNHYVTAIIPAAGRGLRMANGDGDTKQFLPLCGVPVIARTLSAFERCEAVDAVIVVALDEEIGRYAEIREKYGITKLKKVVPGGKTRQESVKNGIAAMPAETEIIAVHDGARCLVGDGCITG